MIKFNDDELEIALVTYNRPTCVKEWIGICFKQIRERNITFSIYDSSTNDETLKIVEQENEINGNYIHYVCVDSNVAIGYKPIIPAMESQCKYLWICADRRYHDFEELDAYIFPKIIEGKYSFIRLGLNSINEPYEKEYVANKAEWFYECALGMTCIGLSIFQTEIIKKLKQDSRLLDYCNQKFRSLNGLGFMGYYCTAFAMNDYQSYIHSIKLSSVSAPSTTSWASQSYTYMIEDFVMLVKNISEIYLSKYEALKKIAQNWQLFTDERLYWGRTSGNLCEVYEHYKENGYWELFTDNKKDLDKVKFYAKAPLATVKNIIMRNYKASVPMRIYYWQQIKWSML